MWPSGATTGIHETLRGRRWSKDLLRVLPPWLTSQGLEEVETGDPCDNFSFVKTEVLLGFSG